MEFRPIARPVGSVGPATSEIELQDGDLLVLLGPARYSYNHCIPGESVTETRISLTFRKLILEEGVCPQRFQNTPTTY